VKTRLKRNRMFLCVRRRAISPAIASIFLIGVAVIGATSAGNAMFKQNEMSQKYATLTLMDASLVKIAQSKTYFAATVKNTGTVTFTSVLLSFADDSGVFRTINAGQLKPGETLAKYSVEGIGIVSGKMYLVRLEAVAADGSQYQTTRMVAAR
jgi:hypothetical protein